MRLCFEKTFLTFTDETKESERLSEDEFEEKYASLSSSDMSKVASAIGDMEDEFMNADDDGGGMNVYDAALIWASNGKDEDYTFGYSEDELEDALR